MLLKPPIVTVTPGSPGTLGREASYECVRPSGLSLGAVSDGGAPTPPSSPTTVNITFSGVGSPYVPSVGESVYVGGNGNWHEQTVSSPSSYSCTYGTSDPITSSTGTSFITAPFCTFTG